MNSLFLSLCLSPAPLSHTHIYEDMKIIPIQKQGTYREQRREIITRRANADCIDYVLRNCFTGKKSRGPGILRNVKEGFNLSINSLTVLCVALLYVLEHYIGKQVRLRNCLGR